MISKVISWFKKYFWVPLVLFVFLVLYFIFGSKKTEKNITKFLEKNRENTKNKLVEDIKDREEYTKEAEEIKEKENETIKEIEIKHTKDINDLSKKEEEKIKFFEKMSNEELANLLSQKYNLEKKR